MSAEEIPSPWAQMYPRAVGLAPDGILVPAGTLRVLLGRSGRVDLIYTGFAMEPVIRNGDRIAVENGRAPRLGDLILCETRSWGDVLRVLGGSRTEALVTGLDACPRGRGTVTRDRVLGVVRSRTGSGGLAGLSIALAFPLWSRWAALRHWWRRISEAPDFGKRAGQSVREKYALQVEGYAAMVTQALGEEPLALMRRFLPPGGSILIAGSGTGGEALGAARAGYRVSGFDFVPAMLQAGRRNAQEAGLEIEFFDADMTVLDLGLRCFDGVYVTPLVYSFVSGRQRRIESLRRLGLHLAPGGTLIFSAFLLNRPAQWLEAVLVWARRRVVRDSGGEFGDWFTWFLTPRGTIGKSYLHVSTATRVLREIRAAGFRHAAREGRAHFVASDFQARISASIEGQKAASLRK